MGNDAKRIFIHATNIHTGGGASLLTAMLLETNLHMKQVLLVDRRFKIPKNLPGNLDVRRYKASILHRLNAERWLAKNVQENDVVLCFGNLPPIMKLRGQVFVYLQNRYLIDGASLSGFNMKSRLRITIERFWLRNRSKNCDKFFVQSSTMKTLLEEQSFSKNIAVNVAGFMAAKNNNIAQEPDAVKLETSTAPTTSFVYLASGEPHKNHKNLVDSWCLLADAGIFPSLYLTINPAHFPELCQWINEKKHKYKLQIENLGELQHEKIFSLFDQVDALIYPSNFESFGLPLIEAKQAGLAILAGELDFVRDVVIPAETFDADSATSISRAVKRYMKCSDELADVLSGGQFMQLISNE